MLIFGGENPNCWIYKRIDTFITKLRSSKGDMLCSYASKGTCYARMSEMLDFDFIVVVVIFHEQWL